jgi:hypothetical protein
MLAGFSRQRRSAGRFVAAAGEHETAEQRWLRRLRSASMVIQRALRRRRWLMIIRKRLGAPIVKGPCGFRGMPVTQHGRIEGVEAASGNRYMHRTCGFEATSWPRLSFIALVESPWFERLSLCGVLANCAWMAAAGPPPRTEDPEPFASEGTVELGFILFFTLELVIKSGAMGVTGHEHTLLADRWNWLDLLVVSISWLLLVIPSLGNYSSMRALRALRPLRTIQRLPGLRRQVIPFHYLLRTAYLLTSLLTLLATRHSPLATRYAPLATRHSPIAALRSPPPVHR